MTTTRWRNDDLRDAIYRQSGTAIDDFSITGNLTEDEGSVWS